MPSELKPARHLYSLAPESVDEHPDSITINSNLAYFSGTVS
jgi:hypothetical protein